MVNKIFAFRIFYLYFFFLCVALFPVASSASTFSSRIAELAAKQNKRSSFSMPVTMKGY